ncbi:MAG TPA: pilus assembly protein PilM [Opitutaceae bacterium]
MRSTPVLAIDCGASRVCAAAFTATNEGIPVLDRIFVEPLEYDTADDLQWVKTIGDAIRRIGTVLRLKRNRISLIVPGHLTLTKYIKVPHVDDAKRARIIQFEAKQNIPYALEEVVWDYQIVHDDGIDFEVALCAIKLEIIRALLAECRAAGFEPEVIEPSCMAQVNAFRFCLPEARQSTLLINIGARSSNLVFLREDRYLIRNITLAGTSVSQAMADELAQGISEAERAKLEIVRGGGKTTLPESNLLAFDNARQSFVTRLAHEITRSIANYRRQTGAENPTRVLLTGAAAGVPELASMLGEKLRIGVELYQPLRGVPFGSGAVEGEIVAQAHLLGETVGAALRLYDRGLALFDLLPEAVRKSRAFRRQEPFYLASAALVIGALAIPILVNTAVLASYREKLANLDAQATPLRRYSAEIAQTQERIERIRNQIEGIKGLVETKSNWITFFTDLQSRLMRVEDVWLEKLQVLRPQGPGGQTSALAGSLFAGLAAQNAEKAAAAAATAPLRLTLSGRLLDKNNPLSKVSQESQNRVTTLLTSFVESKFIVKLENERFDNSQPGILKFEFILVVDPQRPL